MYPSDYVKEKNAYKSNKCLETCKSTSLEKYPCLNENL